jgi:hypothetical protein
LDESVCGRGGDDIASALIALLEKNYLKYPNISEYNLWSDSWIAKNKNSIMPFELTNFIKTHENITQITFKFSAPGHSCVQEVDNADSIIEKTLRNVEYFSLSSIERLISISNRKNSYQIPNSVIKLKKQDFKDFHLCSKIYNYKLIPFTKVFQLKFTRNLFEVQYRTSLDTNFIVINIRSFERKSRNAKKSNEIPFPTPKINNKFITISKDKRDIESMISWCPTEDKTYLENFCAN